MGKIRAEGLGVRALGDVGQRVGGHPTGEVQRQVPGLEDGSVRGRGLERDDALRALAQRLLRSYPELRVLYMSGYSDSLIFRYGVLQERSAFLQKPFSPQSLANKVREVLEGAPA